MKLHFPVQARLKIRIVVEQGLGDCPVIRKVNEKAACKLAVVRSGQWTGDRDPVHDRFDIGQMTVKMAPAQRAGFGDVSANNQPSHEAVRPMPCRGPENGAVYIGG